MNPAKLLLIVLAMQTLKLDLGLTDNDAAMAGRVFARLLESRIARPQMSVEDGCTLIDQLVGQEIAAHVAAGQKPV